MNYTIVKKIGFGTLIMFLGVTTGYGCNKSTPAGAQTGTATTSPVAALYINGLGQSFIKNNSTVVNFDTVSFDTANAVTTGAAWKFTAPSAGYYTVQVGLEMAYGCNWASGEERRLQLTKSGSGTSVTLDYAYDTGIGAHAVNLRGGATIHLIANEYLQLNVYHTSTVNCGISSGEADYISIVKVADG